ncbi:MAG: putative toxin-antitoxin system toxin component, PIN family [Schwartzia sp.]|nr:putative toxin-antitoxin system toxin component, PIN family [Schwartzia sp. (in: firmicutes)]
MMYAVIDTNVLVSALLSSTEDAATAQIVQKLLLGDIIPVYSEEIFAEYREVLQRKKFKFPAGDQKYLLSAIQKYGKYVIPAPSRLSLPDEKDLPFYEAAIMDKSWYLVTGNQKHFPKESFIVTPREMLNLLANKP